MMINTAAHLDALACTDSSSSHLAGLESRLLFSLRPGCFTGATLGYCYGGLFVAHRRGIQLLPSVSPHPLFVHIGDRAQHSRWIGYDGASQWLVSSGSHAC